MSVLSKPDILKHFQEGNIVIDPFNPDNLANTSYDVRLGPYFYRQSSMKQTEIVNPYSQKSIEKLYPVMEEAVSVKGIKSDLNSFLNLTNKDKVILIAPNETILAHTIEFIGGRNGTKDLLAVTTEMRARSSIGRIGISVCKCAGWGDVGYVNRWTMEITNFSTAVIPLPVGIRIAQIIFHSATPIKESDEYGKKGKYQTSSDLDKIKKSWKPSDMLPKLYNDKDLGNFCKFWKK